MYHSAATHRAQEGTTHRTQARQSGDLASPGAISTIMSFLLLLLLCSSSIQATSGADSVLCFAEVNEDTGECEDYLGEGVSDKDCCLNIKYGYKPDDNSPCVACRPAEWSEWSVWSGCTVSCQEGIQQRSRICIGQGGCDGQGVEVRSCSLSECCPGVGGWSSWSSWSPCSVTCETGQRQRTRECNNPLPSCGGDCIGSREQTEGCDTNQICPTHGSWGSWGPWNQCSSSCTKEGSGAHPVHLRLRKCNNPLPSTSPPGRACEGSRQDTRDCQGLPFCAIDGQWGAWQADSECSVTCGVGRTRQKRVCNNPPPLHGGRDCTGPSARQSICNTNKPCPIDGRWSQWNEWSPCSRLDGEKIACKQKVGNQFRHRECQGQSHEGKWCDGKHRESRTCYDTDKCRYEGYWTEWSEWGLCSAPCGKAMKTRIRQCLPKYPDYPDIVAGATKTVEVFFSGIPNAQCKAINGERTKLVEEVDCRNVPEC